MSNMLEFYKERYPEMASSGEQINWFTSVEQEYTSLKKGVVIRELVNKGVVKLAGEESLDFLHRISTNELLSLKENERRNTLLTNEKGRLIDRITLFRFRDSILVLTGRNKGDLVAAWFERYIIMEDIVVENNSANYTVLEFIGPQAESYLTSIFGKAIDMIDSRRFIHLNFEKVNVIVTKIEMLPGHNRFTILFPVESREYFLDYLLKSNTLFNVQMCGEDAYNLYRIENVIPGENEELTDLFNPHETALLHEVNFAKGCYIGQEVIARLDTYDKVQKKLLRIKTDIKFDKLPAQIVDGEGNDAGYLTSLSGISFNGKYPGLAFVRKKYIESKEKLYIDDDEDILIEVCEHRS